MGLGIYIKSELNTPVQFSAIQDYITEYTIGLFKDFLSFSNDETSLYATLHPCEEPVVFELKHNNLICSAKTNSVGPGYHAYLVELIEKLGAALDIPWNWNQEEGEEYYSDETDYYNHRDFKQLQSEMLKWLHALSKMFIEERDAEQLMLTMPLGYPRLQGKYFAISPMRIWTRELFEQIAKSKIEDLEWAAHEFFIWWNKKDDAYFYKNTAIALLNTECGWHYPADDKEERVLSNIDKCFERARQLHPQMDLPLEDWAAIKNLLNEEETDIPDTEFGYKKYVMTFDLAGKWMIDLPGNFYYTIDDNTEVYYDDERNIRNASYERNDDQSDEEFADTFFNNNDNEGTEFLTSETAIAGKAIIYYNIDKETEEEYWVLQGVKVKANQFVLSTICYPGEGDKQWAIETWNSIRR
ncbi:hypothetical protein [Chryseosolibacter indicus]|uniref:Uncharacterized protein n=1 Tax=Chryseosolibacter indicus TaxID=2782351 RepID=A0ABS5VXS7_9BACT|nr:hypothetical protein [Chryseosolibacter indicus]MBT1706209.1 hypothetical protein [Chryseosolibacter indicus]